MIFNERKFREELAERLDALAEVHRGHKLKAVGESGYRYSAGAEDAYSMAALIVRGEG